MNKASETILSLQPVTFRYKKELDPAGIPQLGLVAEDVEKVKPHLVARDKDGKPYTVRYEAVNAMLLNEFLKEHRKNEEQQAIIGRQQKQIDALTAGLQKLSAHLELNKSAPQTLLPVGKLVAVRQTADVIESPALSKVESVNRRACMPAFLRF